MRNTLLSLFLGLFVAVGAANSANAVTLSTTQAAYDSTGTLVSLSNPTASGLTWTSNKSYLDTKSDGNNYWQPLTPGTSDYLSGQFLAVRAGGYSTYTANTTINSIAFVWGSIDPYNTIQLLDKSGKVIGSITYDGVDDSTKNKKDATYGSYIYTAADGTVTILASAANIVLGETSSYITITGLTGVYGFSFLCDTYDATEIAGLKVNLTAVPLPAALPLFGSALLGLSGLRRRKNNKAA